MGLLTDFFIDTAQQTLVAYAGRPTGKTPGTGMIGGNGAVASTPVGIGDTVEMVYDCASGPPPRDCGASAVYKKVCGSYRWVYPKSRRRKQLLTKTDAKGLAALKGILGNGKAMEVWIATHG